MVVVVAVVTAQVLVPQKDEQNAQPLDEVFVILDYRESLIHTIIVLFITGFEKDLSINTLLFRNSLYQLPTRRGYHYQSHISYLISLSLLLSLYYPINNQRVIN